MALTVKSFFYFVSRQRQLFAHTGDRLPIIRKAVRVESKRKQIRLARGEVESVSSESADNSAAVRLSSSAGSANASLRSSRQGLVPSGLEFPLTNKTIQQF